MFSKSDQTCLALFVSLALIAIGYQSLDLHRQPTGLIDLSQPDGVPSKRPVEEFRLDINRADWPEWTLLPRIGETLARRIIATREQRGGFQSPDDLRNVPGIGAKTLANLRPYLLPVEPLQAVTNDDD